MEFPKYSRPEIERRWLVALTSLPPLPTSARLIEDKYVPGGRQRLRTVTEFDGTCIYKLGKKYSAPVGGVAPVVSVYLTPAEAEALARLPGRVCRKRRFLMGEGALDLYEFPKHAFAIFEMEFVDLDAAARYEPPPFVQKEVTDDPAYNGFALAR